jgi:hypothetical protein
LGSLFSIREVRETLKRSDPTLAEKVKRSSLATALGRMGRARKEFAILEEGKGKKPTIFRKFAVESEEVDLSTVSTDGVHDGQVFDG